MTNKKQVVKLSDNGTVMSVVRNSENRHSPYYVYYWRDKYHKRLIAKCEDLVTALKVMTYHLIVGG